MAIVLVMGVPGAGKTFLSNRLLSHFSQPCYLFSFDQMYNDDQLMCHLWNHSDRQPSLLGLYGSHNQCTARSERKRCEAKVKSFLMGCTSATGISQINAMEESQPYNGETSQLLATEKSEQNQRLPFVIVDDIFYLSSMRRPFERMARSFRIAYIVIFVDTTLEKALLQNRSRPSHLHIPEHMIRNIFERMELPDTNRTLIRYSGEESIASLVEKIETMGRENASNCCTSKPGLYDVSNPNRLLGYDDCWERLDIELRKIVGELMKQHKDDMLSQALRIAKKQLVNELRTHDIREWNREHLKEMLLRRIKG